MDVLKTLLEKIPAQYHVWVALLVLLVYYGFPKFQEWRSHGRYFDSATRVLTYKKLLYEVASIRKQAGLDELTDPELKGLEQAAAELRPVCDVLPGGKRFLAGLIGSLTGFAIFLSVYFTVGSGLEPGRAVLGSIILSVVAGITTLLYRSNRLYKSALFGGVSGLVIANVIGLLTS
jgi:hypothetical protein